MTYQTEIRGVRFFMGDDGRAPYRTLATAEIYIPELSANVADVALTWSKGRGWIAQAPNAKRGTVPPIQWNHHGAFAVDLAQKLKAMFLAMGGKNPEEPKPDPETPTRKRIWVCAPPGYHPDETPDEIGAKWSVALDAVTEAVDRAERHAAEPEPEPDEDDLDGLHRTLGVTAEAEACDRAGI